MTTDTDAMTDRADAPKHSPAPWAFEPTNYGEWGIYDAHGKRVAGCCDCGSPTDDNGALLARAPELLSTNALLVEKVARLEHALRFYAERTGRYINERVKDGNVDPWAPSPGYPYLNTPERDGGLIARTALNASREGAQ